MSNKKAKNQKETYALVLFLDETKFDKRFRQTKLTEEQEAEYADAYFKWTQEDTKTRGPEPKTPQNYLSGPELMVKILMNCIHEKRKNGNLQSLKKTKKLNELLKAGVETEDKCVILSAEDYDYIRKAFYTADHWQNTVETAELICLIEERFVEAEE